MKLLGRHCRGRRGEKTKLISFWPDKAPPRNRCELCMVDKRMTTQAEHDMVRKTNSCLSVEASPSKVVWPSLGQDCLLDALLTCIGTPLSFDFRLLHYTQKPPFHLFYPLHGRCRASGLMVGLAMKLLVPPFDFVCVIAQILAKSGMPSTIHP